MNNRSACFFSVLGGRGRRRDTEGRAWGRAAVDGEGGRGARGGKQEEAYVLVRVLV